MGTVTCTQVITRCAYVLVDETNVRWTVTEMIGWINDACREIVVAQPEANAKIANVPLVAGTKQVLPAGAIALGRLTRNMGVGGATPGEAPRQTTQMLMDLFRPAWHADTATLVVKNFMKDTRTPRIFYVWPPMSGATNVEAEYSAIPTPVTAGADVIPLDDFYVNPIVDYVLYRAFSKDVELAGMASKADQHRAAFEQTLGLTKQGEAEQK